MEKITLDCERCKEKHEYEVNIAYIEEGKTLNFACKNIKRLPRLSKFRIDFSKNHKVSVSEENNFMSLLYGSKNIGNKIERKNEINNVKLWLIYDFDEYFEEIVSSYIIGSFYPVATSCTTLAERLVNLFILKMRNMYDKSFLSNDLQRYVYTRNQNWQSFENNMKVLKSWNLISLEQKKCFNNLLDIRNRAVHFQDTFDPQNDALDAIKTLHEIIDSYFSPFVRSDILRVFEIPGEIWVKEEHLNDPFVKAFVLPCCNYFASKGTLNKNNVYHEKDAIIGNFSEEEFIQQRKEGENELDINYEPVYKTIKINNTNLTYRII